MALRNTPDEFGLVTRLLHWGMMALVLVMLGLGLKITDLEPGLAGLWLIGLHKTMGFLVLALILMRFLWHIASPPPLPLGPPGWERVLARAVHRALYALLVVIPLTGWAGSSSTGIDVMIADRWTMPDLVAASERGEALFFGLHGILTKLLIGLILLHVAGTARRVWLGDGTLRRMILGDRGRA